MAANIVVPAASTGPRTAHHVMAQHAAFPEALRTGRAGVRRFWAHIEALRYSGEIVEDVHVRPNRHRTVQLLAPVPKTSTKF